MEEPPTGRARSPLLSPVADDPQRRGPSVIGAIARTANRSPINNAMWGSRKRPPQAWREAWGLRKRHSVSALTPGRNCQAESRSSGHSSHGKTKAATDERRMQPIAPWRRPPWLSTPAMGGKKHSWGAPQSTVCRYAAWLFWDTSHAGWILRGRCCGRRLFAFGSRPVGPPLTTCTLCLVRRPCSAGRVPWVFVSKTDGDHRSLPPEARACITLWMALWPRHSPIQLRWRTQNLRKNYI